MKIIPYTVDDALKVAEFFREIFDEWGWDERPTDHMDEPHKLFYLPDGGLLLLVIENRNIIGTAGVIKLSKVEGLIKRFYLKKQYRGTGTAQSLLQRLIKEAQKVGLKKLVLDVSRNNIRATHFYEKEKFLPTTVEPISDWPESNLPEEHFYFYKIIDK